MTIRLKLTLYWAAVLGAILVIAGLAVFLLFERQQWGELDSALMEEADTSVAALAHAGSSAGAAAIVRHLSEEKDLGPRRRVRVTSAGKTLIDFGARGADLPVVPRLLAVRRMFDGDRGVFRFAVMPFTLAGRAAYLEDGVDASAVRESIARLRTSLLLIIPLLLIGCVGGGYWLAGRALVPMSTLTTALACIEPRDLGRRLDAGQAEDEVARLTRTINGLLDRLERASLTERRFASDAAHELRTPLAILRTGLEVALGRERTAVEYRAQVESALGEVLRLCRMADELLTLARLDGEVRVEHKPLDLRALVNEVAEAVEPLVQSKNLALVSNSAGAVVVDGNRSHLQRLLINLLDNALKFTPANGEVRVDLATNDGIAVLTVTDSGPGIAPSDLPHVFERFFRAASAKASGSGLGLSLCSEIVRLHGGEIRVANRAEGGSEFVVTLPLARRGDAAARR